MHREILQRFRVEFSYPVVFTRNAFAPDNGALAGVLRRAGPGPHRVLVVLDSGLTEADPGVVERLAGYASAHRDVLEPTGPPLVLAGGEACKSTPAQAERVLQAIERRRLCRHSFVIAVGGGAVLDTAGYAASVAHRGVRVVRMPSTVLAQNDAGVGVKTGINAFGRKNFLGTFDPPFAVIDDLDLLETLPERDKRAGVAEAVKVALIRDRDFFDSLYRDRMRLARFDRGAMERMIMRCAELHLEHIRTSGDPFERGSARPLDFGHWSAHRLEETAGGDLRHGEAVAIGIALDCLYAEAVGLLGEVERHRVLRLLLDLGFDLCHWTLRWLDIPGALESFREHLGGALTLTFPRGIGRRVELCDIDTHLMARCLSRLGELAPASGACRGRLPARAGVSPLPRSKSQ